MGKGVVGSTYCIQCKTLMTTVCVVCDGRSSALIDGAGGGVLGRAHGTLSVVGGRS